MDPVTLSIRQFTEAWRVFCTATPGYSAAVGDGVEYLFSGLPIPFFNVAVLTGQTVSAAGVEACARSASQWAGDKGVPWFLVVTHDALPAETDAAAILDSAGYVPAVRLTGMLASSVAPLQSTPAGLELTEPASDAECADLISVNGAAYGMSLDAGGGSLGAHSLWKNHSAVVGRVGGQAVTCSGALLVEGYRYVAFVATDPAHQRRGYAEAAMRRSLDLAAAAHGAIPSVLHATEAGRPVYERMGYAPIAAHTMFIARPA